MTRIEYTKIETEKVGRMWQAKTVVHYKTLKTETTMWGNSEQNAIDKLMKFLGTEAALKND